MESGLDFNKIKDIDKYFYLKRGDHLFICQVIGIDAELLRFKLDGYYHSINYYPYLSESKLIIKNCNTPHVGSNGVEIVDEINLDESNDEILNEFNDAIDIFNNIIKQIEDHKVKRILAIKQLNTLDLKVTKCEVLNKKYLTEAITKNNNAELYINVSKKLLEDIDNIAALKSKIIRTLTCLDFIRSKKV